MPLQDLVETLVVMVAVLGTLWLFFTRIAPRVLGGARPDCSATERIRAENEGP